MTSPHPSCRRGIVCCDAPMGRRYFVPPAVLSPLLQEGLGGGHERSTSMLLRFLMTKRAQIVYRLYIADFWVKKWMNTCVYDFLIVSLQPNWRTQGVEYSGIYIKNAEMRANRALGIEHFQRVTVASWKSRVSECSASTIADCWAWAIYLKQMWADAKKLI